MNNGGEGRVWTLAADFTVLLAVAVIVGTFSLLLAGGGFIVPEDTALRIRLDDTLTSTDSQVGYPFSATVINQGDYRNARVYGHVSEIDMSGKVRGHTSMMLRFDRLVMPDGRRSPIHAEIVELYHTPSGEKVDVEGAIESGSRGRKSIEHTIVGTGAGALLGGIFGGGKGGRHFTAPPQQHRAGSPHPRTGAPQSQAAPVRSAGYRWRRA